MSIEFQAFWEAVGVLLLVGAAVLVVTNGAKEVREIIFAGVLMLQSLPFLAAVAIALLENSCNSFAFWRSSAQVELDRAAPGQRPRVAVPSRSHPRFAGR